MKSIILLSEGDRSTLSAILHHQLPGLIPHPLAHISLLSFIGSSRISQDPQSLESHIAMGDIVILSDDKGVQQAIRVVPPAEARSGTERVSILTPLGLAVLGRKVGETVRWTSPTGLRRMIIREVRKTALAPP